MELLYLVSVGTNKIRLILCLVYVYEGQPRPITYILWHYLHNEFEEMQPFDISLQDLWSFNNNLFWPVIPLVTCSTRGYPRSALCPHLLPFQTLPQAPIRTHV
jgi:hypothetical protein